ncbi:MAG TPA: integrating conjugative element protein [Halieaceae bacterium]|jgi:integrating conjugative element protein (TIGR03765 family)|uniref:PFL_4695 family integrating conjugative element protein n=1 Tax=Haliea sp. TaxID=1932666 RepID=UPI000C5B8A10|nr:integrating conjugative element protein [Haliea sp.]HBQ42391.1 integrating conjugative element protein [Halieaceae bacterium]MAD65571.1 integrating conjugative element protein [Haliea sp.]MAY92323.1 integrating conjugative element protein [Haliea sp.]MBK40215.1 integrating conjugative element protein [Haliea sp.]MBP70745.1 integrating conjugative element protein [Haliea sp.]|tara:strand:- start:4208 stop:4765 length:558 start_codon:yes stop_codon:yes gene_type:complete
MRGSTTHWALAFLAGSMSAVVLAAHPGKAPVVVFVGSDTVPTAPYIEGVNRPRPVPNTDRRLRAPGPGVTPLATRLPLMPDTLQPGTPAVRETTAPVRPFFVMGMDRRSLDWLAQSLSTLLDLNATGLVVQAANPGDWQLLREKARVSGLSLSLMPDTGLAEAYGIARYPVLVVPEGTVVGEGGS